MAVLGCAALLWRKTLINIATKSMNRKSRLEVAGSGEHPGGGEVKPGGGGRPSTASEVPRGADVAKKCAICHNSIRAARTLSIQSLRRARPQDRQPRGYEYSDALKSKGSDS
jgi:hypothetical protein